MRSQALVHRGSQPTWALQIIDIPDYKALSYAWGDSERGRRIIVNGKRMAVKSCLLPYRHKSQIREHGIFQCTNSVTTYTQSNIEEETLPVVKVTSDPDDPGSYHSNRSDN
ncbi:hypothetical protein J1614_001222 [Plenodomus biglobosus]|nr:hypothetical protein J1614_001222 [Plenodomus biglobosus]